MQSHPPPPKEPQPFPHPQPLCSNPPQQQSRIRMRNMQLHPPLLLLSHPQPHPQFVAAKSLILFPPDIFLYTPSYVRLLAPVYYFSKKIKT